VLHAFAAVLQSFDVIFTKPLYSFVQLRYTTMLFTV